MSIQQQYQIPTLAENLTNALKKDFFVVVLVSSMTKGKFKSMNLPFGLGKTTFSMKLSYILHGGAEDWEDDEAWDEVFSHMKYYPSKLVKLLIPNEKKHPKIPCAIYEATQMTAPADQSVPAVIRRLASYITENRPECSVLVLNAPNINSIAAPLRRLVAYEVIIWERGHYEVQQYVNHKNFSNPLQDILELIFVEGDESTTTFSPLPERIQKRYDEWRAKEKIPFNNALISELERYERLKMPKAQDPNVSPEMSELGRALAARRWGKDANPSKYSFTPPTLTEEERTKWTKDLNANSKKTQS